MTFSQMNYSTDEDLEIRVKNPEVKQYASYWYCISVGILPVFNTYKNTLRCANITGGCSNSWL